MRARSSVWLWFGGAVGVGAFLACSTFQAETVEADPDAGDAAHIDDASFVPDAEAPNAYRAAVLADGPVAYWRMNAIGPSNDIADEMPTGTKLFLQGGGHELVPSAIGAGSNENAIRFNGTTSYARAADAAAFEFVDGAPFTIECWARRETIDGGGDFFQNLMGKVNGFNDSARGYLVYVSPEHADDQTGATIGDGDAAVGVFGRVVPADVWGHYAVVFDGLSARLYIDGTEEQSVVRAVRIPSRPGDFIVGRDPRNDNNYWGGTIDEVAVYDKPLSLEAIARHVAAGRP